MGYTLSLSLSPRIDSIYIILAFLGCFTLSLMFRFQETLERLAAKLESVYNAAGGKKMTIISHSMGGLLVKCFMCLHSDVRNS